MIQLGSRYASGGAAELARVLLQTGRTEGGGDLAAEIPYVVQFALAGIAAEQSAAVVGTADTVVA